MWSSIEKIFYNYFYNRSVNITEPFIHFVLNYHNIINKNYEYELSYLILQKHYIKYKNVFNSIVHDFFKNINSFNIQLQFQDFLNYYFSIVDHNNIFYIMPYYILILLIIEKIKLDNKYNYMDLIDILNSNEKYRISSYQLDRIIEKFS